MTKVTHGRFLAVAAPIIFANITIPIIGLVDTAVIGHLGSAVMIAGAGMGASFLTGLYHLFNFLMTGVSAFTSQARGEERHEEVLKSGLRGMVLGLTIGLLILLFHNHFFFLVFLIFPAELIVNELALNYISVRVFSAPFALANFALIGWLLALEKSSNVLVIQISVTLANVTLDLIFVLYFAYGVQGVAFASAISEALGFAIAIFFCRKIFVRKIIYDKGILFSLKDWVRFSKTNSNIFLRTLMLECVAISYIFIGAILGTVTQAANQIMYQFLSLASYALDGFAFSSQVFVGVAYGQRNLEDFRAACFMGFQWGFAGGILLTISLLVFGKSFIEIMTVAEDVRQEANRFLFLMALTPLTGVASWILDGIFLGALETKKLRQAMFESVICYFFVAVATVPVIGNYGLWISVSILFLCRALTLIFRYKSIEYSFSIQ